MHERIGETNIASNGLKMTIIAYRKADDIDIQFEDGKIVTHRRYNNFKKGTISHSNNSNKILLNRIGEKNINKQGLEMEIIEYRNQADIDVRFSTGYIFYHAQYGNFKIGQIREPNYEKSQKDSHIGMTKIATNGQKMTIIAYRNSQDLDVQFEDGTIVCHKPKKAFLKGGIDNPNCKSRIVLNRKKYLNKIYLHSSGLIYKIIEYNGNNHVSILFEDGLKRENITTGAIKNKNVAHPYIKVNNHVIYSDNYFGFKIRNSFETNDKIYFEVYIKDDFFALMTLQEIYTLGKEKHNGQTD